MNVNYPIIDADGHVLEKDRELHDYLGGRYRARPVSRPNLIFRRWTAGTGARACLAKIPKLPRRAGWSFSTSLACTRRCSTRPAV